MLVSKRALGLVCGRLDAAAARCAELARRPPRDGDGGPDAPPARGPDDVRAEVRRLAGRADGCPRRPRADPPRRASRRSSGAPRERSPRSATRGLEVARLYAHELDLPEPALPWHADRQRIAELGAALATAAGVAGQDRGRHRPALADRGGGGGRGCGRGLLDDAPEAKPGRVGAARSPAPARRAGTRRSCSRRLDGEHERAAGAWQSEWAALSGALACAGGAAANVAEALAGLEVDAERMRQNLDATGGLVLAERVSQLLAPRVGRAEAHEIVRDRRGDRLVPVGAGRGRAGGPRRRRGGRPCSTRTPIWAPPGR